MTDLFDDRKTRAAAWFRTLRDQIVAAFEAIEDDFGGPAPAGRFEVTPTTRPDGGGGLMSVMRGGRVFEKIGVNVSAVHGTLAERAQKSMAARGVPGMDKDPRFWASGISLVAHMQNPHAPAIHLNTRMFWTPHAAWFGGGTDLNPCIEYAADTQHFHATLQAACDGHSPDYYQRFKAWADEYFYIPHRNRARGVGGPPAWPPMRCGAVRIASTAKRWFWPRPAAPTHRGVTTATLEPKPTWRAGCAPSAGQCPGRAA